MASRWLLRTHCHAHVTPHSCEAQRGRSEKREVNTAMNRVPRLRRYSDSGVHEAPCAESPNRGRCDGSAREQEAVETRRRTTPSEGDGTVCGVTGRHGRCEGISMFSMNTSSGSLPVPWLHRSHPSGVLTGRSDSLRESPLLPAPESPPTEIRPTLVWKPSGTVLVSPFRRASCCRCVPLPRHLGARRAERTRRLPQPGCLTTGWS